MSSSAEKILKPYTPEYFMKQAYMEAKKAAMKDEVPVGAIVVSKSQIIGRGHNQTQSLQDVTAHAEIIAITAASSFLGNKYLDQCTLYVTLEPCVMCAGALKWSQLGNLVYACTDEKNGFMVHGKELLHPKTKIQYGLMELQCKSILQEYFKAKRDL